MNAEIDAFNCAQTPEYRRVCERLSTIIDGELREADSKIWHAHPVWFLAGNPIVGYSKLKSGVRLMFWSGASFLEPALNPGTGKFQDASITYNTADEIEEADVRRWLGKSRSIQWDYGNIRKAGKLVRIV
jgi:hypothetical protein